MKRRVWRGAVAAAVTAAALGAPAPGNAATPVAWKGIVVAKEPARNAFVTASAGGVVRTVRTTRTTRTPTVGQAITVRGQRLRDGTFRLVRVTPAGRATKAQLRGVLIRYQPGRYLVSAGSSVLSVRAGKARTAAAALSGGHRPGDRVLMNVSVARGTLTATSVLTVGHTGSLELEGIFLGLTPDGKLRVAVANRGEVLVSVPAGTTLPPLSPGAELELGVTVDAAGAFTLVNLGENAGAATADENDQGDDNDDQGEDNDDQGATTVTSGITTTTPSTTTDDQGDDNDDQGQDGD
jgi:hypothetical protein